MKQSKFTDVQIISFLKQADAAMSFEELCRTGAFSQHALYKWLSRFGGMESSGAAKLQELEAENNMLKKLLDGAHLEIHVLKSVIALKR